jgi:peptidase E
MLKNHWSNIYESTKKRINYISTKTRDALTKNQLFNVSQREYGRLDQKKLRKNIKKNYDKAALKINENVSVIGNKTRKLLEGNKAGHLLTKIANKKYGKHILIGAGALIASNIIGRITSYSPEPVIPKSYDRGYDNIKENLTDFSSPVNLCKAATRSTIMPYYSSVRKGIVTSVKSVQEKNISLFLSKKAIGHTRY